MEQKARMLKLRRKIKRKKPDFLRQEGWKHPKLKKAWRQPKGRHSKLRMKEQARGRHPSVGWGSPGPVKGLSKHGLNPVRIMTPFQLDVLDPKLDGAIVGRTVGKKKRMEILRKAEEKNIRVFKK